MKRIHRLSQEDSQISDEPKLEISSLIDVCFLLLIYFLVTTTIQPREQDLRMTVPVPRPPDTTLVPIPPMLIELRQDGEVVVNPGDASEVFDRDNQSRHLPHLSERLKSMAGMGVRNEPRVLLRVHDDVEQQRYVDVLNCLAGAGISEIALQD